MVERQSQSGHIRRQPPPSRRKGGNTVRALRVEPDPLSDVLLNQNQTQWWDGLTWRYIHAEPARVQPGAVGGANDSRQPDVGERQVITTSASALVPASAQPEYPVVLHWKLGRLTATPVGVAFDMTARSVLFGRHKRNIHRVFAYAELSDVEVHLGRASIGLVLRTREGEIQGCQGCTNADEVDAFLAVLVQHDVDVLVGSAATSVMIGRYSG